MPGSWLITVFPHKYASLVLNCEANSMNNNATPPPGPHRHTVKKRPPPGGEHVYPSEIRELATMWEEIGLPWDWHDDLLAYAEHMRHADVWRHRWHLNDDWLYDVRTFDHDDVLHDPHGVGTQELDYNAWFTELEQNSSEVRPVFKLLTLCWDFTKLAACQLRARSRSSCSPHSRLCLLLVSHGKRKLATNI